MTASARECKLFSNLISYLAAQRNAAFAILDSACQVDIESMGWSTVPANVREKAIGAASSWREAGREASTTIEGWGAKFRLAAIVGTPQRTWRIIVLVPPPGNDEAVEAISQEETQPIFVLP